MIGSALNDILNERDRQDAKFPGQWDAFRQMLGNGDDSARFATGRMCAILGEEYGEVCRDICEMDLKHLREELIQLATVAVRMVEALDG